MRETRPLSTSARRMYYYRKAASVPSEMRQKVLSYAAQLAATFEAQAPDIIFVEEIDEAAADYRFPANVVTHSHRRRPEYAKRDSQHVIYVNTTCPLPDILVGLHGHIDAASKEPREHHARLTSATRHNRRS